MQTLKAACPRCCRLASLAARRPQQAATANFSTSSSSARNSVPFARSRPSTSKSDPFTPSSSNSFKIKKWLPPPRKPTTLTVRAVQRMAIDQLDQVWLGDNQSGPMVDLARDLGLKPAGLLSLSDEFAAELSRDLSQEFNSKGKKREEESLIGWDWEELRLACQQDGMAALQRKLLNVFLNWTTSLRLDPPSLISTKPPKSLDRSEALTKLRRLADLTDFRFAGELFPEARRMRRKLILHVGPTNSGKTHSALVALSNARTGVYAGPLRLLAHEVFARFNEGKIGKEEKRLCNLVTGEEQRILDPNLALSSCTVEMFPVNRKLDVGVIDEIQMLGDPQRGLAWTNALVGAQCQELHLCGEESVVALVEKIAEDLGDECIVNRYQRLSPLFVADQSLMSDLSGIRPGDCLVTFSRTNIFAFKRNIEEKTGLRVAVAYGGLPPEVREEQAKTFNEGGYDVLVASDAIGMGLNLKIKRIVFESLHKWDGRAEVQLSMPQIKQIAGRAGRFGVHTSPSAPDDLSATSTSTVGEVTALDESDMPLLRQALKASVVQVEKAAFGPPTSAYERVNAYLPSTTPASRLHQIVEFASTTSLLYSFYPNSATSRVLDSIQHVEPLTFDERRTFGSAPVNIRDPKVVSNLVKFTQMFAAGTRIYIAQWSEDSGLNECLKEASHLRFSDSPDAEFVPRAGNSSAALTLSSLESFHRCLTLYLWLSYRLPDVFCDQEEARILRSTVEKAIERALAGIKFERRQHRKARKSKVDPKGCQDFFNLLGQTHNWKGNESRI